MINLRSDKNLPPLPSRGKDWPSREEVPDLWSAMEYWSLIELIIAVYGESWRTFQELDTGYCSVPNEARGTGPLHYNALIVRVERGGLEKPLRRTLFIVRDRAGWRWFLRGGYGFPHAKIYTQGLGLKSLWQWAAELEPKALLPVCPSNS